MTGVRVLSIHDHDGQALAFDLTDILQAIEPMLDRWTWYVGELDAGTGIETIDGQWLSSGKLVELAKKVTQTIEGTFIAFPKGAGGAAPPPPI